jgi:hypothetical protein
MQTLGPRPIGLLLLLCSLALPALAEPGGIREACRQFIERDLPDPRSADFGEYWTWTVIDNKDGTYGVGAKYRATGTGGAMRNRYTTCIIRVRGKNFVLDSLAHLIR